MGAEQQIFEQIRSAQRVLDQALEDELAAFLVKIPVDQWGRVSIEHAAFPSFADVGNPFEIYVEKPWRIVLGPKDPRSAAFTWLEDLPSDLTDSLIGEYVEIEGVQGDFACGFVWRIGWEPGHANLMLVLDWGFGIAFSQITSIKRTDSGA